MAGRHTFPVSVAYLCQLQNLSSTVHHREIQEADLTIMELISLM